MFFSASSCVSPKSPHHSEVRKAAPDVDIHGSLQPSRRPTHCVVVDAYQRSASCNLASVTTLMKASAEPHASRECGDGASV